MLKEALDFVSDIQKNGRINVIDTEITVLSIDDKGFISLTDMGNAKKEETAPDGSPNQNVFDIMQGVSINIFVKSDRL